jgi:dipeptide/tripeptide permease
LILISFGAGCLEPNLPAYSGDQYKLPFEEKGFSLCIGLLFVMHNAARVLAMVVGPIVRSRTKCFGADDCYPAVFGVFVVAKLVAIASILLGKRHAVIITPKGNMLVMVCGCIWHALKQKFNGAPRKNHWLDHSIEKYGQTTVTDTRRGLHVIALMPPLIIVATLYFQQVSRWVFQSRQMDGTLGSYQVKPDQVPLVNALSVVVFVPMCEYVFNPFMAKFGIRSNLHRVILGGFLSASAFVVAALVQFKVESSEAKSMHMVWQIPQHMLLALGEWEVF